MTTAYRLSGSGQRLPDLPDQCPSAVAEPDGQACAIGISWFRTRKTGPAFPLAVCRCRVHVMAFTAYPPGFGPYLRQPLIAVCPAGESLESAEHEGLAGRTIDAGGSGTSDSGVREFEGTQFDAALSAAAGDAWARTSDVSGGDIPDRWWSTQGRKLTFARRLIGIAPDQDDELRVRIAHLLGVPATDLIALSRDGTGYRESGVAIVTVLRQVRRSARLAFDLLTCAWLIGRLGQPLWWIAGGYRPTAFSGPQMPRGP